MLQVHFIKENKERVLEGLKKRSFKNPEILDKVIALDEERKSTQTELNTLQAESNSISKQIGALFGQGKSFARKGYSIKRDLKEYGIDFESI